MGWGQKWGAVILKKNDVVRESNPGPLRLKLLPYQLSHTGIVNKIKFIHGATHISFAKFLVAPNIVWEPLYISQSLCVFPVTFCKIWKNTWELNSRCRNKIVAQMIERALLIQGSRVRASVSTFCFKSYFGLLEINMVIMV